MTRDSLQIVAVLTALVACGAAHGQLTDEELSAEAPAASQVSGTPDAVPFGEAQEVQIEPLARGGYPDPQGRLMVDVMEGDDAFLAVRLTNRAGTPISGARAAITVKGTSAVREATDASGEFASDDYGIIEFAVQGGQMGLDVLTVNVGDVSTEVVLNVISLEALNFPEPEAPTDKGLAWSELMGARLQFVDNQLVANFPESVSSRAGETVRISGFMTPLEAGVSQKWFLLTSTPPHCYFDIPGGPAGAIEVFAPQGVGVSWEPVILEGRFEPVANSNGTIYRLHEAERISP